MDWIYLDNNATTQPLPQVLAAMQEVHESLWANPSSVHRFGQMARQRVELARQQVALLINARDREIIFTSGGTEANNLALRGCGANMLITTGIEHSAVREPAAELKASGVELHWIPITIDGLIEPETFAITLEKILADWTTPSNGVVLVSVQWANNETGVIQPIAELSAIIRRIGKEQPAGTRRTLLLHVDATQAVGKIPVDVVAADVDLLTLAAHKFHGPKGVGVLFVRNGIRLRPQNRGGPQERDRRGGTENTAGIIGMGVAAELAKNFLRDEKKIAQLTTLRDQLEKGIVTALPELGVVVNSGSLNASQRLWNTTNLGFPRLEAEAILLGLSEKGVCASAGAACSSGSLEPSPVLLAMGIPDIVAHGSVRFSLSRLTTDQEIDRALEIVPRIVRRLAQTLPV